MRTLLIIDVQCGFISEKNKHIPHLIEELQYNYDMVIVSRFVNEEHSQFREILGWDGFSPDSDEIKLAFKPRSGAITSDRCRYSCVNRKLIDLLTSMGVDSVDICGFETDICVSKCAVDLFDRGIMPFVLKDYCGTTASNEMEKSSLQILARYIGKQHII